MFDLLWQYVLIFLMAATPWLEVLVVIPIGVGIGLNPLLVGVISFIGNFIPVLLIVYLMDTMQRSKWYTRFQSKRQAKKRNKPERKNSRGKTTRKLFHKYGLPGLAVIGPIITGIHLTTVIALSFNMGKHLTTWWMGASLLIWTLFLTIASVYSIEWVQGLF